MNKMNRFFQCIALVGSCFFLFAAHAAFTSHAQWREIQDRAQDTVVQIFVQGVRVDMLHPYGTPEQVCCSGSGFFINEQGDIITNAHVVDEAVGIWIQIPSLGKRPVAVDLVSICHERDLALLKLSEDDRRFVCDTLGKIPFLPLGNSDSVRRADEVLVLGYPLGQQSLKSTTGVVCGREQTFIQMDAAINPGSSGGPMLNSAGEVIGISAEKIVGAGVDNVGYAIPINIFTLVHDDMLTFPLLRKPFLGIVMINATPELTDYLGNPQPGGCYVVEIVKDSILHKAGLCGGDMIYEIDGHRLDIYGEMSVPEFEDKISIVTYISHLKIGQKVSLVAYRRGERIECTVIVSQSDLPAIREVYPGYEPLDYEIFAGMVVMPLTVNHIRLFAQQIPGLLRYIELAHQNEQAVIVTHVFYNSEMQKSRTIHPGVILSEINGKSVKTLQDFRDAVACCKQEKYFVAKAIDLEVFTTEELLVALSMDKVLREVPMLAQTYRYEISPWIKKLVTDK
jgi:serine protease Do